MRGFQKGITLGGRTSGSACKVAGGGGGPLHYSVTPVQTGSQELGVRSLEFKVRSLELVWTSSGLSLDKFYIKSQYLKSISDISYFENKYSVLI